jgi:hypothetical protein
MSQMKTSRKARECAGYSITSTAAITTNQLSPLHSISRQMNWFFPRVDHVGHPALLRFTSQPGYLVNMFLLSFPAEEAVP